MWSWCLYWVTEGEKEQNGGEHSGEDEEQSEGEEGEGEDVLAKDDAAEGLKKAKLREPFEVPTSGAFWLHDDRYGAEAESAEPEAAK